MRSTRIDSIKKFFLVLCVLLIASIAWADDLVVVAEPVTDGEFWRAVLEFISGIKGATTIAVIGGLVQLLVKAVNSRFGDGLGKYKLLTVSLLSVVGVVVGLMAQGSPLSAALFSGATLAAFQVFAHQVYKQFFDNKDEGIILPPSR